jgi:hypothetical protein
MKIIQFSIDPITFDAIYRNERDEIYGRPLSAEQVQIKLLGGPLATNEHYDAIRLYRGLEINRSFFRKLISTHYGLGKEEWGAPLHQDVLIYKLGELNNKELAIATLQECANHFANKWRRSKFSLRNKK